MSNINLETPMRHRATKIPVKIKPLYLVKIGRTAIVCGPRHLRENYEIVPPERKPRMLRKSPPVILRKARR